MNFKTSKGTELPLLNLRGKDYLQVAHRIMWFREEHPYWPIRVEVQDKTDKYVTCKATVYDDKGTILQEAHKTEHFQHFQDALEKAETGAIGRALANLGYGTAFAQDLMEHEEPLVKPKLVDSPQLQKKDERNEAPRFLNKPESSPAFRSEQNGLPSPSTVGQSNSSTTNQNAVPQTAVFDWTESARGKIQFMMKKTGWTISDINKYLKNEFDVPNVSSIKYQKDFESLIGFMEKYPIKIESVNAEKKQEALI